MDFQKEPYENRNQYQNRRSPAMATASLILGIVSIIASGCIYPGLICGSLGIILALLSKGGTRTLNDQAITGLCLSAAGLIFTILLVVTAVYLLFQTYGSIDGIMKEYMNLMGADTLEELYETF